MIGMPRHAKDSPLPPSPAALPADHRLDFDSAPAAEVRAALAREINGFHARTFAYDPQRFALLLRGPGEALRAGLIGVLSWEWLFVEAVWVHDDLRGQGVGRVLMARAEAHALEQGCHSAWLDTFQARDFYLSHGYEVFGVLPDYPAGQSRSFLRKSLSDVASASAPRPTRQVE